MSNDINIQKYETLFSVLKDLDMRDIRCLFGLMREIPDYNYNFLFPSYGFTAGEFTVGYVTNMPTRSRLHKTPGGASRATGCNSHVDGGTPEPIQKKRKTEDFSSEESN